MVGLMQLLVRLFYLDWSRSIEFATPDIKLIHHTLDVSIKKNI